MGARLVAGTLTWLTTAKRAESIQRSGNPEPDANGAGGDRVSLAVGRAQDPQGLSSISPYPLRTDRVAIVRRMDLTKGLSRQASRMTSRKFIVRSNTWLTRSSDTAWSCIP
jgi:hypothetical protein